MIGYDFGPSHPMDPVRLALTMRLARELGVTNVAEVVALAQQRSRTFGECTPNRWWTRFVGVVNRDSEGDLSHGLGNAGRSDL